MLQAPKVVSNTFPATNSMAAATIPAQLPMPSVTLPPLPASTAQQSTAQHTRKQHLQLPSQLATVFSPLQSAAAAAEAGKERAAKLAASFAASRSSGFPSVAGRITASETAVPASSALDQQAQVSIAVAAAAVAAKNLIHQNALKAKSAQNQTQPETDADHQLRMEAIRLRNLARGTESPHSTQQVSVASSSQSPASHGTLHQSPSQVAPRDAAQHGAASPVQPQPTRIWNQHRSKHNSNNRRGSGSPPRRDSGRASVRSSQHSPAVSRLSMEAARKQARSPDRNLLRQDSGARKRAASPDIAQSSRKPAKRSRSRADSSPKGRGAQQRGRSGKDRRAAEAYHGRQRERASRGSPTYSPVRGRSSR